MLFSMKDNFSSASDQYAKYRPAYPAGLYTWLKDSLRNAETAWDCATGNGQVAAELANFFKEVYATDISQSQLDNAIQKDNIFYSVQRAEITNFPDGCFDLITVAQAIHWFDFDAFYKEVKRVAKPGAMLVVVGYCNLVIAPQPDQIIDEFYRNIVGPFWDKERKYLDEKYETIPFLPGEIDCPVFRNTYEWTFEQLMGYLGTWSGVKHYINATGKDPLIELRKKLMPAWGNQLTRHVEFPLLLRAARIK